MRSIAIPLIFILSACGTITPNHVDDLKPMLDESVPKQYDAKKGWLIYTMKDATGKLMGGIITPNARLRYNSLIRDYRLQYKEAHHEPLAEDQGVSSWVDKYGNQLYMIQGHSLEIFGLLSQMEKDQVAPDSAWSKFKDAIVQ